MDDAFEVRPPSARLIKMWVLKIHEQVKLMLAQLFIIVHHVTLTMDAWMMEKGCGLLGITSH